MKNLVALLLVLVTLPVIAWTEPQPKFKVGVILPLTGALAEYGEAAKNGIELSVREHPELFKNVEFKYDDSQYDPKRAITSFERFHAAGDVSLVYAWGASPDQALAPIADADKLPMLATTADKSVSANRKYVLRFCYDFDNAARTLLDFLRSKNYKRLGLVKTDIVFSNGIFESMQKLLTPEEKLELVDSYPPDATDFRSTLVKLRSKNFDSLGVFLISGQASQFYRQMKQLNITMETFATDFLDSQQEINAAGEGVNGAVYPALYVSADFRNRYLKVFGNDLQVPFAAVSYEFAGLVGRAFGDRPEKLSAAQIIERLAHAKTEALGASEYSYYSRADGPGFDFKLIMRQVKDGKLVDIPH